MHLRADCKPFQRLQRSSCSPSAGLQSTCMSQRRALTHVGHPGLCGVPLDHLALAASGACVPGSQGTVTIGKTVLARPPPAPRALCSLQTETRPSLSVKEASLPVLELLPEGRASGPAHIQVPAETLTGNVGQGTPSWRPPPAASLQLAFHLPQRSFTPGLGLQVS